MNKLAIVLPALALSVSAHAASAPNPITNPVGATFAKVAEARDGRAFHKEGAAYRATITDANGLVHTGAVRVSRGGAGKDGHPDILGLAIKMHEKHGSQDFTLITAKKPGAYLPTFRDTLAGQPMSSVTPYQMKGNKGTLATQLPASFHTPMDSSPEQATGDQSFELTMRSSHFLHPSKTVTKVADVTVHFGERLSPAEEAKLKFNPYNDVGGVKPKGIINAVRKLAMRGSQFGRATEAKKDAENK